MFADACGKVSEFSRPVVISTRHQDGTIKTECGTFIVLNRDGWIITAGHMYDSYVKYQGDRKKAEEIEELNATRSSRPGAPSQPHQKEWFVIMPGSSFTGCDGAPGLELRVAFSSSISSAFLRSPWYFT